MLKAEDIFEEEDEHNKAARQSNKNHFLISD